MLRIKYNDEFLDIAPGQDGELQRNSPLFGIDNLTGEYTTPIIFSGTEKTSRLLKNLNLSLSQRGKTIVNVDVFNDTSFLFLARLFIESANLNDSYATNSNITGYLLTGISDFASQVKGKMLKDLSLGGVRNDRDFQGSWANTKDFVCAPVKNEYWDGNSDEGSSEWMNKLDNNGDIDQLAPVVPFVRLKYLLTQIFTENSWTVDFTGINDAYWQNIFVFSVKPLYRVRIIDANHWTPIAPLNYRLADYVPPEYSIADFVIAICNEYGWAPVCDGDGRRCRFVALRNVTNGRIKDWTKYAQPTASSEFPDALRRFSYAKNFEGTDDMVSEPDFDNYIIDRTVFSPADLPVPSNSYFDDRLVYCYTNNHYYSIYIDENNARQWGIFADNIYNREVTDATDTIETKCTTLPVYNTKYRTQSGIDYYGFFLTCRQSRFEKAGIRTFFFHGYATETKLDGSAGSKQYPLASSLSVAPNGTSLNTWSNIYQHLYNGVDKGIVPYWFASWEYAIRSSEKLKRRFTMPLYEALSFRWDDVILVKNSAFLVRSTLQHLNYKGFIECTLQPVALTDLTKVGNIYLRMVWENITFTIYYGDTYDPYGYYVENAHFGDLVVYCYSDPLGDFPLVPDNLATTYSFSECYGDPAVVGYTFIEDRNTVLVAQRTVLGTQYLIDAEDGSFNSRYTALFQLVQSDNYSILS